VAIQEIPLMFTRVNDYATRLIEVYDVNRDKAITAADAPKVPPYAESNEREARALLDLAKVSRLDAVAAEKLLHRYDEVDDVRRRPGSDGVLSAWEYSTFIREWMTAQSQVLPLPSAPIDEFAQMAFVSLNSNNDTRLDKKDATGYLKPAVNRVFALTGKKSVGYPAFKKLVAKYDTYSANERTAGRRDGNIDGREVELFAKAIGITLGR
jgi:hypothetical protein